MSGGDFEEAEATREAAEKSEAGTDMSTTGGYVVDRSGRLDHAAIRVRDVC
ncbi:MAG: hypothetical protein ACFBSF_21010 [Leptolyngbyaceae cyanobacterium]